VIFVLGSSRITFTKFPSVWMITFRASLANFTTLLPKSRDWSCYISWPKLTPPPLRLQKHADLRANHFAHLADLWHQPRIADVTWLLKLETLWHWSCCTLCFTNSSVHWIPLRVTCMPYYSWCVQWHCPRP